MKASNEKRFERNYTLHLHVPDHPEYITPHI